MPKIPSRHVPRAPRVAVLGLALLAAGLLAAARGNHLVSVSGDVEIGRGEPPRFAAAREGESVAPGELVRTGDDGRAELDLGRARVRLYPNSLLHVPESAGAMSSAGEAEGVGLERGRSLFDVLHGDDPFEVRTPEVVVSVKGTRFAVVLADTGAAVAVFRGLVGVRSLAAEAAYETLVREGFMAAGHDHFELSLLEWDDPWDAWQGGANLPQLPEAALRGLPRQADAALLEARSAAMAEARREAVLRAAERHPEVAEELVRLRKARTGAAKADVDAIQDGRHDEMKQSLEEDYMESYLNASLDPSGSSGGAATTFELTFIDGSGTSGEDSLHIDASDGSTWDLDEDALESVLEGEGALPSNLLSLLDAQGITQEDFARNALKLFE